MADMVKRKLENYKMAQHIDDFIAVDMGLASKNYQDVVDKIDRIRDFFKNKMDMMYMNFVRKDPYRSFYNY